MSLKKIIEDLPMSDLKTGGVIMGALVMLTIFLGVVFESNIIHAIVFFLTATVASFGLAGIFFSGAVLIGLIVNKIRTKRKA